ncbi:hypothetical protein NDU88_004876 [Pleurodeles waltl]|uniref:Uncharacterized protein n=1 Tax=Pleurodeles waltl TaxID=8319 RepID=A0AAV7LMT9_PLEWA|nr:hypothetical protein NDU88_004876 [Pleurodeles waltl]
MPGQLISDPAELEKSQSRVKLVSQKSTSYVAETVACQASGFEKLVAHWQIVTCQDSTPVEAGKAGVESVAWKVGAFDRILVMVKKQSRVRLTAERSVEIR